MCRAIVGMVAVGVVLGVVAFVVVLAVVVRCDLSVVSCVCSVLILVCSLDNLLVLGVVVRVGGVLRTTVISSVGVVIGWDGWWGVVGMG